MPTDTDVYKRQMLLKNSEEPFASREANCFAGIFPFIKRSSSFFLKNGSNEKKLPVAMLMQLASAAPNTPPSQTTISKKSNTMFKSAVVIFKIMLYFWRLQIRR